MGISRPFHFHTSPMTSCGRHLAFQPPNLFHELLHFPFAQLTMKDSTRMLAFDIRVDGIPLPEYKGDLDTLIPCPVGKQYTIGMCNFTQKPVAALVTIDEQEVGTFPAYPGFKELKTILTSDEHGVNCMRHMYFRDAVVDRNANSVPVRAYLLFSVLYNYLPTSFIFCADLPV